MVVLSKNPVNSVFFLILVFALASILIFMLNVEFLGILYIIIYVGAIAVLFLFVIMMMNIRLIELEEQMVRYIPLSVLIGLILFIQIYSILKSDFNNLLLYGFVKDWVILLDSVTNTEILGYLLYTHYVYAFIVASLVLLVAMVGSIVLTLYHEVTVKRQEFFEQVERDYFTTVIGVTLKR